MIEFCYGQSKKLRKYVVNYDGICVIPVYSNAIIKRKYSEVLHMRIHIHMHILISTLYGFMYEKKYFIIASLIWTV